MDARLVDRVPGRGSTAQTNAAALTSVPQAAMAECKQGEKLPLRKMPETPKMNRMRSRELNGITG